MIIIIINIIITIIIIITVTIYIYIIKLKLFSQACKYARGLQVWCPNYDYPNPIRPTLWHIHLHINFLFAQVSIPHM